MIDLGNDVHLETLESRSIDETEEVLCTASEPSWMDPIIEYLKFGKLPNDPIVAQKVKHWSLHYILIKKKLYKRSHSSPLLKCLLPSKMDYALREVHEEICGNHLGGWALAYKILWQGYYWPTMQKDAIEYVKKCDACQRHAPVQHQPATKLTTLIALWSFVQWGINILGPFPLASV